jgi:hypothetical protein
LKLEKNVAANSSFPQEGNLEFLFFEQMNLAQLQHSCHQVPLRQTKEVLATKRMQWVPLGKPKGTIKKAPIGTI